ncbi:MAG: membrane protein [bacterium]|nr:MAG: membrane protein [bacterium]
MSLKKNSISFYIGMGVSLSFILYAVTKMDLQKALNVIWSVNPLWLIPIFAMQVLTFYFRALRWRCILEPLKRIKITSLMSALYIGVMGNMVFPMRIGEIMRAYLISKKERISVSGTFATIMLERCFDFLAMFVILILVLVFANPVSISGDIWRDLKFAGAFVVSGLIISFTIFYMMAGGDNILNRVLYWLLGLLPQKATDKLTGIFESFRNGFQALNKGGHVLAIFLYNAGVWVCITTVYCLFLPMFGMDWSLEISSVMTLFVIFGVMVPSSPGWIGPYHAAVIFALSLYGVDSGKALGMAVLIHLTGFTFTVIIGIICLYREKVSLREIGHSA